MGAKVLKFANFPLLKNSSEWIQEDFPKQHSSRSSRIHHAVLNGRKRRGITTNVSGIKRHRQPCLFITDLHLIALAVTNLWCFTSAHTKVGFDSLKSEHACGSVKYLNVIYQASCSTKKVEHSCSREQARQMPLLREVPGGSLDMI